MNAPHPIPYQGSKRQIASYILSFFPQEIATLVEPFAGSAALSIAAACQGKAARFHLNDINQPLMALWDEMIHDPRGIAHSYSRLWHEQQGQARTYYDQVRDEFNRTPQPALLLYLLARCVKASVRYNPKGEFNQSPDNRRLGRNPERMAADIFAVSHLFRGRITITSQDYREVLTGATQDDLVYLDPPYQGVGSHGDPRYFGGVEFAEFVQALAGLNKRDTPFILSYDGRTGDKVYGQELPAELNLYRVEVNAGRSSQSTLLGRREITYESIYLSPALVERVEISPDDLPHMLGKRRARQLHLFAESG